MYVTSTRQLLRIRFIMLGGGGGLIYCVYLRYYNLPYFGGILNSDILDISGVFQSIISWVGLG